MGNVEKKVYLVGAGPGDKGLLTVKGKEILEQAEVVVYDRLVSDEILEMIPSTAEKINVGKNVSNHPVPQSGINQILLEKALEGKLVVRLKGGDPFLFGRGGEELELLRDNHIPFEVVPGITSAIAAAAYAGIPVTHRDFCSSLHIITGHAKAGYEINIDYKALVSLNGTLVFMMSVSSIEQIARGLTAAGMSEAMPVAVIENGTRANQRKFVGTLCSIADIIIKNNVKSPAAIIVGNVCSLSDGFDWFSSLPLKGCRVLVTRPQRSVSRLAQMLKAQGADVALYPCIATKPIDFSIDIEKASILIFTSAVGVECFFAKLDKLKLDCRSLHNKSIAAVGTQTAKELSLHGITADFVPAVYDGEHLAKELLESGLIGKGANAVVYRAQKGGEELIYILIKAGVMVSDVAVYETQYQANDEIKLEDIDIATFTSASCVESFVRSNAGASMSNITAVCIGKQTAICARAAGMEPIVAKSATLEDMCVKIAEIWEKR